MGRRSDHSREELRAMALDAAVRLLESEGIAAVTTRRIAREIGYAPGTLYNLFADLDDLRLQVNGASLERLRETLAQARRREERKPESETAEVVMALARAQLRFMRRHPALWRQLFQYRLPPGRAMPAWYAARMAAAFAELERALVPALPDDTVLRRRLARALWAGAFGICEIASLGQDVLITPAEVEEMTRLLVQSTLRGALADMAPPNGGETG